jgi:N-acetylneuraminic acid mutarotase
LNLEDPHAKWRELPSLPGTPRAFPAVAAVEKYLYVLGGLLSMTPPLHVQKDAYRYDTERNTWTSLPDLPRSGYAWSAAPIESRSLMVAGRADGKSHRDILLLDLESLEMKEIGLSVIPTMTAPLIQVGKDEWWLIGGEPDSNKTRTDRITVIRSHQ